MTKTPQGGTKSVVYFQRIVLEVLRNHVPQYVGVFVDDIVVMSPPKTKETEKECEPSVLDTTAFGKDPMLSYL